MLREHTRTYFLGKLARELEVRGLACALRPSPPSLRVSDPETLMFSEIVDCVAMADGWVYRWSWGDVLSSAEDPAAAAERIVKVFTSGTPHPLANQDDL
ncbi:hypothetical protein J5X84_21290 [Streptosporangiaceae bacterium NEAU-GS5]|nr:hypothetical protein [Streptosporangiaceae bacterium NEAU-GS5]